MFSSLTCVLASLVIIQFFLDISVYLSMTMGLAFTKDDSPTQKSKARCGRVGEGLLFLATFKKGLS